MKMIKWKKPSGKLMQTNEHPATVAKAMELGWKRVKTATDAPPVPAKAESKAA